jgi:hypothetical protein
MQLWQSSTVQSWLRVYSPFVKDVHGNGYEIMLPVNASTVIVVIDDYAVQARSSGL